MKKDKSVVSSFSYSSRLFHELLTSSNFGIPERLVPELNIRIKKHKKLRLYLSFLLNRLRSGKFRQRLPVFIGPKLQFQKAGQHLVNFQFRPYSKDWTELMLLARARGASANLIFITLVEFDLNEREESNVSELLEEPVYGSGFYFLDGVPTIFTKTSVSIPANNIKKSAFTPAFKKICYSSLGSASIMNPKKEGLKSQRNNYISEKNRPENFPGTIRLNTILSERIVPLFH
ncbi:MAG: DUF1564 domain-containing protein [Leptospira sp.]|nr:DUF1564 domain-containing protein [Leptospira sp.]